MTVPVPPDPFAAKEQVLGVGTQLYRVHRSAYQPNQFNPGRGAATRFAFFGDPIVPVLYAAFDEDAALCESILHDVPKSGGSIEPAVYEGRACSRVVLRRDVSLASLVGIGERALGVDAADVCSTSVADYPETVAWAEAAHRAGFDGLAYPSSKASGREAQVLFGDRVTSSDLQPDPAYRWSFDDYDGIAALVALCRSVRVTVRLP